MHATSGEIDIIQQRYHEATYTAKGGEKGAEER